MRTLRGFVVVIQCFLFGTDLALLDLVVLSVVSGPIYRDLHVLKIWRYGDGMLNRSWHGLKVNLIY